MKIGILTYHLSHNYGAFLQAYALTNLLKEKFPNHDIELINFNMLVAEKYYKKVIFTENRFGTILYNYKRYKTFIKASSFLPQSKEALRSNSIEDFQSFINGKYDLIIVGSDEIWRLTGSRGFPNPYWLPGKLGCIKMSCAASSRSDFEQLEIEKSNTLCKLIEEFTYIGVRDKYTFDSIEKILIKKSSLYLNCDPTLIYNFAYNKDNGLSIIKKRFGVKNEKPVVGLMIADSKDAQQIIKSFGNQYNFISLFQKHKNTYSCADLTPFEWIDVISSLDFFVTSFFHGICFSIKTNIPFAVIEKNKNSKEKSKGIDLLDRIGMMKHFFSAEDILNGSLKEYILKNINTKCEYESIINNLKEDYQSLFDAINKI